MKKILFTTLLLLTFALLTPKTSFASEGTFELKNTVGDKARCFGLSVLMPNNEYNILISCRDILYPGGTEVTSYVTWANRLDNGNPIKLGTLGVGKVEFQTKNAFTSIFVTKETSSNVRSPQGETVMRGDLQKISLLESANNAAYNPTATPTPTNKPSSNKLNVLRFGGTLGIIALIGVIAAVLFLIRSR